MISVCILRVSGKAGAFEVYPSTCPRHDAMVEPRIVRHSFMYDYALRGRWTCVSMPPGFGRAFPLDPAFPVCFWWREASREGAAQRFKVESREPAPGCSSYSPGAGAGDPGSGQKTARGGL